MSPQGQAEGRRAPRHAGSCSPGQGAAGRPCCLGHGRERSLCSSRGCGPCRALPAPCGLLPAPHVPGAPASWRHSTEGVPPSPAGSAFFLFLLFCSASLPFFPLLPCLSSSLLLLFFLLVSLSGFDPLFRNPLCPIHCPSFSLSLCMSRSLSPSSSIPPFSAPPPPPSLSLCAAPQPYFFLHIFARLLVLIFLDFSISLAFSLHLSQLLSLFLHIFLVLLPISLT